MAPMGQFVTIAAHPTRRRSSEIKIADNGTQDFYDGPDAAVAFISLPQTPHFWLVNGRIPQSLLATPVAHCPVIPELAAFPFAENLVAADVEIRDGYITAIAPPQTGPKTVPETVPQVDMQQGLIWPCFVDIHTHLDKGQSWNRVPNPDGTFASALDVVQGDAEKYWDREDLYRRMDFSLHCSYAHGTQALRTHFDAFGSMAATALEVIHTLRQEWSGRLNLQAASLVSLDYYLTPAGTALADQVAAAGAILGGVAYTNPDLIAQVDRVFALAAERGLDLDFHVDESLNPEDQCLRAVAQAKLRHGFAGRVVCDHCCSLSVQSPEVMGETLKWVREAQIGIISLPLCNLYLQDRQPNRMPRYRGVTVLHELKQWGIPVAIASDNCRDPFYAYGDLDGLEVFTQATRIGQLDRPIADWARTVTSTPADLMGLPQAGRIGLGQSADLVLFKARTFNELLSRPQADRVVIRQGRSIDTTLPDYRELDDLVGIA
ncbi:cytosine deaminase [Leptolyngbya sp. PCC 6406]|uniref:cytosine deaminase n=1 Tax=Leptolyngbya sp. PCC 6406 TaxID=1173264 RepID=UPI0002ABA624|nr:cytosine deaminase [Leptolyngbya sp. PCC 6406]